MGEAERHFGFVLAGPGAPERAEQLFGSTRDNDYVLACGLGDDYAVAGHKSGVVDLYRISVDSPPPPPPDGDGHDDDGGGGGEEEGGGEETSSSGGAGAAARDLGAATLPVASWKGHGDWIRSLAVCHDFGGGGGRFATCGDDDRVRVHDVEAGAALGETAPIVELRARISDSEIRGCEFVPGTGGSQLIVCGAGGARVFDVRAKEHHLAGSFLRNERISYLDLSCHPTSSNFFAASASSGEVHFFDKRNDQKQALATYETGTSSMLFGCSFTPDGCSLLVAGSPCFALTDICADNGGVEDPTFKIEVNLSFEDLMGNGLACAVSPQGDVFAFGGTGGRVALLAPGDADSAPSKQDYDKRFHSHGGDIRSLAFHPSGNLLLAGTESGRSQVFRRRSQGFTKSASKR